MAQVETGECLCAQYKYQFERDKVVSAHHCHCIDCRKMTGSGKATIVMLPTDALMAEGELKTYSVKGSDGSTVTRAFCPHCGSQLISYVEELPQLRFVKAGSLADGSWIKIDSSFWSATAEPWSPIDKSCPAFEKNPPLTDLT